MKKTKVVKTKTNIAVYGSSGRMGVEISSLLEAADDMEPTLGISSRSFNPAFKKTTNSLKADDFKNIDVLIDFSNAEAFSQVLKFAVQQKKTLVSGTTGLSEKQKKDLLRAGEQIAVLWAPNMSLGVAALSEALQALSAVSQFDFQIEEVHHTRKKDSPSGTALFLQAELEKAVGKEAPITAIRAGGVFGEHEIRAYGQNETLVFSHKALNRKLFAEGALAAVRWIVGKKPGLYEMKDIFKA